MNYRELFHEIMHYGDFDRMPVIHWAEWPETRERWSQEGLAPDSNIHEFLDAVPFWITLIDDGSWLSIGSVKDTINLGLFPVFEEEVLEETEKYRIYRGGDGVICKDWKHQSSIPHYIDFTLKATKDWDEYKKRLQPDPARISADLDDRLKKMEASGLPLCFPAASLMGWIRNWMGVENMSYLMYDDRDLYAEMVMTIADLVCWGMEQILPRLKMDLAHSWEDISGRSGPLVSPKIFDECVAPGYRKIRSKLEEYGINFYSIDSDGDISELVGHWLDCGVNIMFPLEVGPFGGDALTLRKKYGKELRLMGNFDKLALEKSHPAIEAEIDRLMPLMKDGGYIMLPDHHITPGVALEDYQWYLERVRNVRF